MTLEPRMGAVEQLLEGQAWVGLGSQEPFQTHPVGRGLPLTFRLVGTSQSTGFRWKGFLLVPLSPSPTLSPGRCSSQSQTQISRTPYPAQGQGNSAFLHWREAPIHLARRCRLLGIWICNTSGPLLRVNYNSKPLTPATPAPHIVSLRQSINL